MAFPWVLDEVQDRPFALLEWIVDQPDDSPMVSAFYDSDDSRMNEGYQDLRALADAGLIDDNSAMGGLSGMSAEATPRGRTLVARRKAQRDDVLARKRAVRMAILRWLAEEDATADSGTMAQWDRFHADQLSKYFGDLFSPDERDRGAGWLHRHSLIAGVMVNELQGPARPILTDDGVNCVERYDCDPDEFLSAKEKSPVQHITWNVSGEQVQVATGDHARQSMNIGPTVDQMTLAMQGLVEILDRFGLAGDRSAGDRLAQAAAEDLRSAKPDGSATQRFITWVKGRLVAGADKAVTAAITAQLTGLEQDAHHMVQAIASGILGS